MIRRAGRGSDDRPRGQALVEFSLVLIPFVMMVLAIFDVGRGIYMSNGVSEAAREIARATSVHQCAVPSSCVLGTSAESIAAINTQKALVPGLGSSAATITFACTTVKDVAVTNACGADDDETNYIRVTVNVPFSVATPMLGMVAPTTLSATAHIEVP